MKAYSVLIILTTVQLAHAQDTGQKPALSSRHENIITDQDFLKVGSRLTSGLRDEEFVPVDETDSTYDISAETWFYSQDRQYQYCVATCNDSIVTFLVNGTPLERDIYTWDSTGVYVINQSNQLWNGNAWVNNMEYETPVQYGCYILYQVTKSWNGASWDTLYAIKEDLVFDTDGRIAERDYYRYISGQWIIYRKVFVNYGINDTIEWIDDLRYSTSTSDITSGYRDTAYTWIYFTSFCNSQASSYMDKELDLSSGTWLNLHIHETIIEPSGTDTIRHSLTYGWNGTSYDTISHAVSVYDYMGNWVSLQDWNYDSLSHSWKIGYSFQHLYTYGSNDELLKDKFWDYNCSPGLDSLYPCYVYTYFNFIGCGDATGLSESDGSEQINLYPNPASNVININLASGMQGASILIYDIFGRKIQEIRYQRGLSLYAGIGHLSSGTYLLELRDNQDDRIGYRKFLKE